MGGNRPSALPTPKKAIVKTARKQAVTARRTVDRIDLTARFFVERHVSLPKK
jgi:hypothetical protein